MRALPSPRSPVRGDTDVVAQVVLPAYFLTGDLRLLRVPHTSGFTCGSVDGFDRKTYRDTICGTGTFAWAHPPLHQFVRRREAVESSQICPKCGRIILQGVPGLQGLPGPRGAQGAKGPQGQTQGQPESKMVCRCSTRRRYWLHSRETILLLCVVGLVIAFGITGFAARLYHGRRAELARSWFDHGNAELKAGRAAAALSDFRAALVYAQRELPPDEQQQYELDFVQALIATGNSDEARSYLLDMWERAPGNSRVNLELARLAARTGNDADAKRYYDGAIYGVWDRNAGDIL